MSVEIHPIKLSGTWDLGYALDIHTIKSIPLGEDPYGHQHFQNERSQIGELLYQFKYKGYRENIDEIVDTIIDFLNTTPEMCDVKAILPVPPTKQRHYQPTIEIANELARRLNIFSCDDVLVSVSQFEMKELSAKEKESIAQTIKKTKFAKYRHNILLIDDLYRTGTTLKNCVKVLREDPLIDKIYVLTVTKTKTSY